MIASSTSDDVNDHSASLAPMIKKILASQHIKPTDLDAVAVSIGPGSYTGLRVGLSTAKAICYATGRPLLSVDTLQSLAWSARKSFGADLHNIYVSVLDARRQDAYVAVFDHAGKRTDEDRFLTVTEDCLDHLSSDGLQMVIFGEGTAKWSFFQGRQGFHVIPIECNALNLMPIALDLFHKQEFADLSTCVPKYLKPPHITIPV